MRYKALGDDERLAIRDRTRARLWIGTALSKEGENDYAVWVMTAATREFEDLEDVALMNGSSDSPMQRVRLNTAHAHILLSDPMTADNGLAILAQAAWVWPEVEVSCASEPLKFDDYVQSIGNEKLVIDMLVGDLQRVIEYPKLGFAIAQDVSAVVLAAYDRLLAAGFDSRIVKQF